MRRILSSLAVVAATVGLAAGCGGGSPKTASQTATAAPKASQAAPVTIAGQPCSPNNLFMQCSLNGASQSTSLLGAPLGSVNIFGVDTFGAGNPLIAASFDCSYLSGSPGGKDWTSSALAAWHSRGKSTCVVWETSGTRALDGFAAGQSDAVRARSEAASLGIPTYQPIRFAVDTDTSGASVRSYFEGVHSVLGSRTGVYAGIGPVAYLENAGITTPRADWQTLAWSNGQWGRACLRQTSINTFLGGESVDFDHAVCADWGQVPAPVKPKPRLICYGKNASTRNATCKSVYAKVKSDQKAVTASTGAYKARGCPKLISTRNKLQQRWTWFDNQLRKHPKVKRASRLGARKITGRALNSTRRVIAGRQCVVFQTRAGHFGQLIIALKKQYS